MGLNFGVLGVSHSHAGGKIKILPKIDGMKVLGLWDPDPYLSKERAESWRQFFPNLRAYRTPEELLQSEEIDAIMVEGETHRNMEFAQLALQHGKHVAVEKPMSLSVDELRKNLALAENKGKILVGGYQWRYNSGFQLARDLVRDGVLGEVFFARARIGIGAKKYGVSPSKTVPSNYYNISRYPGGIMMELGCHMIDMIVALLGRAESVTSFLKVNDQGVPQPFHDNTLAILAYQRVLASVEAVALEAEPFRTRRLEVYGTEGTVILDPLEPPSVLLYLKEEVNGFEKGWQSIGQEKVISMEESRERSYVGFFKEFEMCAVESKEPEFSASHELAVQEAISAAIQVGSQQ